MHCSLVFHDRVVAAGRILFALIAIPILVSVAATEASAQRRYSKTFPASKNIRLQLHNWSGSIVVETWDRAEIRVVAKMESPNAKFTPEMNGDQLIIDVTRDNRGADDIGNVNFEIRVPPASNIDVETRRGNITVRDIQGSLVRAHITSEGDIELTGIRAGTVVAENTLGNITFDGELLSGGTYKFSAAQGDINISLPNYSKFRLVATAPMTRQINLGSFASPGLNWGDGRRVTGNIGVGDGQASLTVTNYRGKISFIGR